MQKIYDIQEKPKRVMLVSVLEGNAQLKQCAQLTQCADDEPKANELEGLCKTLALDIIAHEKIRVREKSSRFGIGAGKAESLSQKASEINADFMVFNFNPSPSQQRNWEELSGIPVIDRQELIIRIFADRAATREAELQVKLAELTYFLPRLTHKYVDLSRQRGGRYGTKGSGETKLETDRRKVEKRITILEKEIEQVRKQRMNQRRLRKRSNIPVCAIVGYTNAGKSSLLNALTGANVPAEDKLFATLDAVTRRFQPVPEVNVLLTDTVGFIRDLPHSLIKAFRSTLEEAALADILIHILDASSPDIENNFKTTLAVLRELNANEIPVITLLNKIDRLAADSKELKQGSEMKADASCGISSGISGEEFKFVTLRELQNRFPGSLAVSLKNGTGLDAVKEKIASMVSAE